MSHDVTMQATNYQMSASPNGRIMNELTTEIDRNLAWAPNWMSSCIILGTAMLVAWGLHTLVFQAISKAVEPHSLFMRSLVSRSRRPTRLAFMTMALATAHPAAPLPAEAGLVLTRLVTVAVVLLVGWLARTALRIWTTLHLRQFKLGSDDNFLARKHATQLRLLQRVAETLIVIVTAAAALMTFDSVRQYGVSLLASAGAVGVIAGLALQPILKNLVAGIQLLITQPIRIDDALYVEGEWGHVEEITSTYVVVRLWDLRSLIVPLTYFIEKPFQNWTREGSELIGTVMLYTNFDVPVAALRAKLEEVVRASALWNGQIATLQVTDLSASNVEIRMLVSAHNSGNTFDLRCEVREAMMNYLQESFPSSLPRIRIDVARYPTPTKED